MVNQVSDAAEAVNKKIKRRYFRSRRKLIRTGLVVLNILFFVGVSAFVINYRTPQATNSSRALSTPASDEISDPLDTLSSADIAVNVAQLARLDETTAVINNADSQIKSLDILPVDSQVVAKPQIVSTDVKTVDDITTYVVTANDTVSSIADKFNISADSVRWSNGLIGDYVQAGTTLDIPPIDGFVYTVKEGDTLDSLASRFSTSKSKIVSFNDIEISGLVKGSDIVIPDGKKTYARTLSYNYLAATYGYNGYDYGYCTYYVANKTTVPANWGNAKWWDDGAARTPGYGVIYSPGVGEVPAGAIMVSNNGYYGHVAYVEKVLPDGSLQISEMNTVGWNVRSEQTISKDRIGNYNYIIKY